MLLIYLTVEFYFSDANLPFDKFLFTLSRKDPDGWVPLSVLTSFKRMRLYKDTLGMDQMVAVLRSSEKVQINSEGDKVRRVKELVPQKDQYDRSVYVKGFPIETETLQAEMEEFFGQFGEIASVRMRRDTSIKGKKPSFKGSVFVEFVDFDQMKAFISKGQTESEDDRPKFAESALKIMSKDDYCKMKMEEKGIDPSSIQRGGAPKTNGTINRNARFNAFKELDREARGLPSALGGESSDKKTKPSSNSGNAEEKKKQAQENRKNPLEFDFNDSKLTTNPDGTIVESGLVFPEQSVLAFMGAGEGGNWRDLKETLISIHPTSFVDFPQGAMEGAVGFKSTLSDEKLAEIIERNLTVGGKVVTWSRVDEEQAREFYLNRANFRAKILLDQREEREAGGGERSYNNRDGGRGGGRGGRGGSRGGSRGGHRGQRGGEGKRKREDGTSAPNREAGPPEVISTKKVKTEGE